MVDADPTLLPARCLYREVAGRSYRRPQDGRIVVSVTRSSGYSLGTAPVGEDSVNTKPDGNGSLGEAHSDANLPHTVCGVTDVDWQIRERTVGVAFAMGLAFALVLYRCGLKFDYSMAFGLSATTAHLQAVEVGAYECFARALASRAQRAATRAREAMARCMRLVARTARASSLGALPCIMVLCLLRSGSGTAQGGRVPVDAMSRRSASVATQPASTLRSPAWPARPVARMLRRPPARVA